MGTPYYGDNLDMLRRYPYCVHPEREAIIARTLAEEGPPGK